VSLVEKVFQIDEIKEKVLPIFVNAPVYRAVLFGSYAKGGATDRSDLDIVLDSRGELRGLYFYGVLEDLVTTLDKKVDLFELSEIRPGSPVMDAIERDGVVIYER
jgi:predicted nucleotidyltransferase